MIARQAGGHFARQNTGQRLARLAGSPYTSHSRPRFALPRQSTTFMDDKQAGLAAARQMLAQQLESLSRAGVLQIGKVAASVGNALRGVPPSFGANQARPAADDRAKDDRAKRPTSPHSTAQDVPMPRAKPAPALAGRSIIPHPYPQDIPEGPASRQRLLDELNSQVRACQLCSVLARQRTQTVFGVGSPAARVVFFGEAPGADEDRQGRPFSRGAAPPRAK